MGIPSSSTRSNFYSDFPRASSIPPALHPIDAILDPIHPLQIDLSFTGEKNLVELRILVTGSADCYRFFNIFQIFLLELFSNCEIM